MKVISIIQIPFTSGPPIIELNNGLTDMFSLLAPHLNEVDILLLTQNVVLSTNLIGRWYKPDNSSTSNISLNFPLFHQSDEGLYGFYVTNWGGQQQLATQINISLIGKIHYVYHDVLINLYYVSNVPGHSQF